jgi:post-segregation antitoxin (ccd killing protein)
MVMRPVRTVTVKVDDKLRKRMASVSINWSRYIREAIAERIEREERKKAADELIESLKARKHGVPKGFIQQTIRETRKTR